MYISLLAGTYFPFCSTVTTKREYSFDAVLLRLSGTLNAAAAAAGADAQ